MKKVYKKKKKLPKKLLFIPSSDKHFHESWYEGRDELNIPHPWRGVFLAKPNAGKTATIKNIILRADPPFESILVMSCDPNAKEWEDIGAEVINELPPPEEWSENEEKTLVVLDDIDFNEMDREQKHCLDRLCGHNSTHNNLSLACCAQDTFSLCPIVRKCSNLWCIWKPSDMDSLKTIGRRTGYTSKQFDQIFKQFVKDDHDSIWIDTTKNTPYPLRLNGYKIILSTE